MVSHSKLPEQACWVGLVEEFGWMRCPQMTNNPSAHSLSGQSWQRHFRWEDFKSYPIIRMKPVIRTASLSVESFLIRQRSEYLCMTCVFAVQLDYSLRLGCSEPNIVVVGTWFCSCLTDVLICFALLTPVSALSTVIYLTSVEPRTRPSGDFSQLRKWKVLSPIILLFMFLFCSTMFMSGGLTSIQRVKGQHLCEHVCFGCQENALVPLFSLCAGHHVILSSTYEACTLRNGGFHAVLVEFQVFKLFISHYLLLRISSFPV